MLFFEDGAIMHRGDDFWKWPRRKAAWSRNGTDAVEQSSSTMEMAGFTMLQLT